jgi:hypothetical protein
VSAPTFEPAADDLLREAFAAFDPPTQPAATTEPPGDDGPGPGRGPDGAPLFDPTPLDVPDLDLNYLGDIDAIDVADLELDGQSLIDTIAAPYSLAGYNERAAVALALCVPHLTRLKSESWGIVGNADHYYGYHLSRMRLRGTGYGGDYSLAGIRNAGGPNDTACALDLRMSGWKAARQWVSWARVERAAGRLPEIAELIGSLDGQRALYAADSTGWRWTRYLGDGHVAWAHLALYRSYAGSASFPTRAFGRWTNTGLYVPKPKPRPVPSGWTQVRRGEGLIVIGRRVKVPWQNLAKWNNIRSPYIVFTGQWLKYRADAPARNAVAPAFTDVHPVIPAAVPDTVPAKRLGLSVVGGTDLLDVYADELPLMVRGMGDATGHGQYVDLIASALNTYGANIETTGPGRTFDGAVYAKAMAWRAVHDIGPYRLPGQPLSGYDHTGEWGVGSWASILGQQLLDA